MAREPILCYLEAPWAWFTTANLTDVHGDDWDDAPYEHNAGAPYEWCEYMAETGVERYKVVAVAFEGGPMYWREPCDGHLNSPFSVEQINEGAAPWLASYDGSIKVNAGTPLSAFKRVIKDNGGRVWVEEGADG